LCSHSGPSLFTGIQPLLFLRLLERTRLTAEYKHSYEFRCIAWLFAESIEASARIVAGCCNADYRRGLPVE